MNSPFLVDHAEVLSNFLARDWHGKVRFTAISPCDVQKPDRILLTVDLLSRSHSLGGLPLVLAVSMLLRMRCGSPKTYTEVLGTIKEVNRMKATTKSVGSFGCRNRHDGRTDSVRVVNNRCVTCWTVLNILGIRGFGGTGIFLARICVRFSMCDGACGWRQASLPFDGLLPLAVFLDRGFGTLLQEIMVLYPLKSRVYRP